MLEEVLQFFESVSGLEILASETPSEQLTFKLVDVPWDQALDLVAALNGLRAEFAVGRARLAAR